METRLINIVRHEAAAVFLCTFKAARSPAFREFIRRGGERCAVFQLSANFAKQTRAPVRNSLSSTQDADNSQVECRPRMAALV